MHLADIDRVAPENYIPTAGELMTGTSQRERDKTKKTCVYCGGSHKPDQCSKLTTRDEKIAFLRQPNRCFNCLGANHKSDTCFAIGRCRHCRESTTLQSARHPAKRHNQREDLINWPLTPPYLTTLSRLLRQAIQVA